MTFEPLTPERRRELTRRHLLDAAALVFARDGFHGATLDAVASTAGFTKGAVYSNFKNKADLFLALLDDRVDSQFAVTQELLESGSSERDEQLPRMRGLLHAFILNDNEFGALYLEFVLYARRNSEARERLVVSARRERALIEGLIERQRHAAVAPSGSAHALAEFARALTGGLVVTRLVDPEAIDADMLDTMLDLMYEAMAGDPAVDPSNPS